MNRLIACHRSRALCCLLALPAACGSSGTASNPGDGAASSVGTPSAVQAPAATAASDGQASVTAGAAALAPGSANPSGNTDTQNTAASAANTMAAGAATPAAAMTAPTDAKAYPDLRGACTIDSGYPDDHACILPPAASEGIQVHIGPKDYKDTNDVAKFIMHPGEESSQCWIYRTPNTEEIFFQSYVLSGRAGTHHILGSKLEGNVAIEQGFGRCADTREGGEVMNIGPMPMATKAYMPRSHVAPENEHIAERLPAHVLAQADMHYYNFTDHDIIREIWMNLYTAPREQITGETLRVRGMGGFSWNDMPIEPGTDKVYQYECPIVGNGRVLELLGHYHAHGVRFSASIKRKAGPIEKVFEMYNYEDPAGFEYNSVIKNPTFSQTAAGASTGILEVHDGDVLAWECHIINNSDTPLRYTNEVKTGEMCNLWGHSFGMNQWDCLMK